MSDITIRVESLSKVHRTAVRRSGVFGASEISRNLPPSWAQAIAQTAMRQAIIVAQRRMICSSSQFAVCLLVLRRARCARRRRNEP